MAITINGGTGVITGVSVGGLPDGIVDADTLASGAGGVDGITSSANATAINIDANEIVTMPNQPCFLARLSSNQNNCTGDATAPTVALNTEVFDLNSDFNTSTYTFTAPVTGKYLLMGSVRVSGVTGACEAWKILITTSNQQWQTFNNDSTTWDMGGSTLHYHMQIIADMDAADTAYLSVAIHGESGTPCDLDGGHDNRFCGVLVA